MGGKKKLTLSQAEKAQARGDQEGKKTKVKEPAHQEKRVAGIIPPNPKDEKVIKEIQKMRVLTPYILASRFNLRLSAAKDFLEELRRQGVITHVSNGGNTKIYKPL